MGQIRPSVSDAQGAQKVHSYVQMYASVDSGGRPRSQHSQFGLSSSVTGARLLDAEACLEEVD